MMRRRVFVIGLMLVGVLAISAQSQLRRFEVSVFIDLPDTIAGYLVESELQAHLDRSILGDNYEDVLNERNRSGIETVEPIMVNVGIWLNDSGRIVIWLEQDTPILYNADLELEDVISRSNRTAYLHLTPFWIYAREVHRWVYRSFRSIEEPDLRAAAFDLPSLVVYVIAKSEGEILQVELADNVNGTLRPRGVYIRTSDTGFQRVNGHFRQSVPFYELRLDPAMDPITQEPNEAIVALHHFFGTTDFLPAQLPMKQ